MVCTTFNRRCTYYKYSEVYVSASVSTFYLAMEKTFVVFALALFVIYIQVSFADYEHKCSIFREFDSNTLQCVCSSSTPLGYDCRQQMLSIGMCMSYDHSNNTLWSGYCPYQQSISGNISFDAHEFKLFVSVMYSGHELNEAMCGHLNREGLLCGKCKPGYGTAVYSKGFKCVKCNGDHHMMWMWVLYLVLEVVPLTALYLAIIIFNIRATSPPFTSFLFHSQLFSFLNTISVYKILLSYEANNTLYHFTMTVLDIWNLDALRHLIPLFCVSSSLSNFQVQLIRLASAVYPLVLVVVSYVLIELHARNCKLIVLMWRPFHRCFACFRRKWDPRSSNITAFSTLSTLSMFKLLSTVIYTIYPNAVRKGDPYFRMDMLYVDPYVHSHRLTDLPWPLLPSLTLIVVFAVFLPIFTLCIYPTQICRRVFFCCKMRCQVLKLFVETFQGHYKDGTNATRDYRAASSLVFILRIFAMASLYSLDSRSNRGNSSLILILIYILIVVSLFYAILRPCKKAYMNNFESILYGYTALSILFVTNTFITQHTSGVNLRPFIIDTFLTVQLIPSFVLLLAIIYKILTLFRKQCSIFTQRKLVDSSLTATATLPDRMIHPNQYTSLIQHHC